MAVKMDGKSYEKERMKLKYIVKDIFKILFSRINVIRSLKDIKKMAEGAKIVRKVENPEYYPTKEEFFASLEEAGFGNIESIGKDFMGGTFLGGIRAQKLSPET